MILGAKTFKDWKGEMKQKCICGSVHPMHHQVCMNCMRGKIERINWNDIEGINRTNEDQV